MKCLLPPKTKTSIARSFRHRYTQEQRGPARVQVQEDRFEARAVELSDHFPLAYAQLWLFCTRHFPNMLGVNPRKDCGKAKPIYEMKQELTPRLATLAFELGFRSTEITRLKEKDPIHCAVKAFIETARPRDSFQYDVPSFDQHVSDICQFLQSIPAKHEPPGAAEIVSEEVEEPVLHRCGRPYEGSYLRDRRCMFLHHMLHTPQADEGRYFSSFGAKQDIFRCFFGNIADLQRSEELHLGQDPTSRPSHNTALTTQRIASSVYSQSTPVWSIVPTPDLHSSEHIFATPTTYSPAGIVSLYEGHQNSSLRSESLLPHDLTIARRDLDRNVATSWFYHIPSQTVQTSPSSDSATIVGSLQAQGHFVLYLETCRLVSHELCLEDNLQGSSRSDQCSLYLVGLKGLYRVSPAAKAEFRRLLVAFSSEEDAQEVMAHSWPFHDRN